MAEGIVSFVLEKLSDAAVKEFLLIHGVGEQVETLSRELGWIKAFLKDADMKQIVNEREKLWVKEVSDIAYDIENVINNASFLKASENPPRELRSRCSRIIEAAKRMWRKPKKLPALHNLAVEMNKILERIQVINESRVKYGIHTLGEGSGERLRLPVRPPVLPDVGIGGRVIVTTSIQNTVDNAEPYKLSYLSEESSLELLFKKALPNRDLIEGYPDELYEVGKQYVKKCSGLPLALLVLGGLLLNKDANYAIWSKMLQTMNWGIDGRECTGIIATSLPFVLKSCFMYFAAFPEDHEIDAKKLFRMWVAERLVSTEESRTLEDTAESFLEDLVKRYTSKVQHSFTDLYRSS
ncbi:putative disease resistance RPP13-like protein 3 [Carex rostrata]